VPEVKELRNFFKRTGFIKASKIDQVRKHTQQKVKDSDRFVRLNLRKQVGQQTPCSGTVYFKMSNITFNFRHLSLSSQFPFIGHLIRFIDNLPS